MAFIITVLRISFTFNRAFNKPGINPQTQPVRKPIIIVVGMISHPGQSLKVSGHQVAIRAPAII
jgi:hypothetical protein